MNRTVKIEMLRKGVTQKQIAEEYGVSKGQVSNVISGRFGSNPLKKFIADRLGVPVSKLWGKAA